MMKRSAVAKVAVVGVLAVLVVAGAVGIYFYTTTPTTTNSSTNNTTSSTSNGGGSTTTNAGGGAPAGWQDANGAPQGAWASYLGYIPHGYSVSPHLPNAAVYPCPSGMNPTQCQQFQASCGNGVCDPNESCATCRIDCGVPGQLTCDPYTGRAGAPVSVCQVGGIA